MGDVERKVPGGPPEETVTASVSEDLGRGKAENTHVFLCIHMKHTYLDKTALAPEHVRTHLLAEVATMQTLRPRMRRSDDRPLDLRYIWIIQLGKYAPADNDADLPSH